MAISVYLVNKVTFYLDLIFAIACFLQDLTKPHCSHAIDIAPNYPSAPSSPPVPLKDDSIINRFPTEPLDNSESKPKPHTIPGDLTDTGNCNPKPPNCKPDSGLDPVEEITEQFLDNLVQEALDFHGQLSKQESNSRTTAVGQVKDNLTGKREIVVTTSNGAFTDAQNTLARARGYTQVKTKILGRPGWHAEGRLIEWAYKNNKIVEAIGVSRDLCPDCAQDIDSNGIKTKNLRYGNDYFTKNADRRPKKRPNNPSNDC